MRWGVLGAVVALVGCAGAGAGFDDDASVDAEPGGPRPDLGNEARPSSPAREVPPPSIPDVEHYVLRNAVVVGRGVADVEIDGGYVVALGNPTLETGSLPSADLDGYWLTPAFIDSHVHLAYWDVSDQLGRGGVAAVVDLAAPVDALDDPYPELDAVLQSGPMLTAPGGYPLDSWGANGYGIATANPKQARDNVAALASAGAAVIKIPIEATGGLDDATIEATIDEAHQRGMKVAVHALHDAEVRRAGSLGADLLAHAPVGPLEPETVELWRDRAVVPTLDAFGPNEASFEALGKLRGVGAVVLYGTDLGNTRTAAINHRELDWMAGAGMTPAEILDASTLAPAKYWGLDELGRIEAGARASLLVLSSDPLLGEDILARPALVLIDGRVR